MGMLKAPRALIRCGNAEDQLLKQYTEQHSTQEKAAQVRPGEPGIPGVKHTPVQGQINHIYQSDVVLDTATGPRRQLPLAEVCLKKENKRYRTIGTGRSVQRARGAPAR